MIAQVLRFAGVGAIATFVHVVVALLSASILQFTPQIANSLGFVSAVAFSYIGHGRFTFATDLRHNVHMPRFVFGAITSFVLSTLLTQVITVWLEAPFVYAMASVAILVPAASFLIYKFWVFSPDYSRGP
ncbi:MAG: GtrA family protein [Pseudomonadota bacterium]